tara:strand:- start:125 stop:1537 length:1413 start_codon:yes stop_codon:yes gene_type:complete
MYDISLRIPYKISLVNSVFFISGCCLNSLSYNSFSPVFVAIVFYIWAWLILHLTRLGGIYEHKIFSRVFNVCLFWAGVSAVYSNQLSDIGQLISDAGGFFDTATTSAQGLSIEEIEKIHEGSLAIVLWGMIYDLFALWGFAKARYIGITVNITAVALSSVFGIKIVRELFGEDEYRFRRFILLVSSCGLFWLFASIHLRDGLILLVVTILAWLWIWYLNRWFSVHSLIVISGSNMLAYYLLGYLRAEFAFVPIGMLLAAAFSFVFSRRIGHKKDIYETFLIILVISVKVIVVFFIFYDEVLASLVRGNESYTILSTEGSSKSSLGSIFTNQPPIIRLLTGPFYLLTFPIPLWNGFQLDSAYHLFKSLNVIFLYFTIPLLIVAIKQLLINKGLRSRPVTFLVFILVGFTLSVAISSMETRHWGAFFMPFFILCTVPDLRIDQWRSQHKMYLTLVILCVIFIHSLWFVLKFS